jgi:hypothetical protein
MTSGVKLTKGDKRELINLLLEERDELRCAIVRELKAEAKELTSDLDPIISDLKQKLEEWQIQLSKLEEEKEKRLCSAKLFTFGRDTYRPPHPLHPRLAEFDEETRAKEREILLN